MSLEKIVSSSPLLTRLMLSHVPPRVFEERGVRLAGRVLRQACTQTSAYPAFLAEHGIADASWETFPDLPITTKSNYLDRFPLPDRCLGGDLHRMYVIERSSGMGGGCYYWPRLAGSDELIVTQIDMAMRMFFHVDRVPTLMISTFALGMWVGGVKVASALRAFAEKGTCPVTVVSPGVNVEETLQCITDLGPYYDQILIFGYPPFLKTLVDEGAERGIDWPRFHVKFCTGGEGIPEQWRDRMVRRMGGDPDRDLYEINNSYGAADIGNGIGTEYPFTVLLRRLCMQDGSLCSDLFGHETSPSLFQYNPGVAYVEDVRGELVFTVTGAIPLVRYAIHDAGGTVTYDRMMEVLRDHGYDPAAMLQDRGYDLNDLVYLPFMFCYGRADGTVTVGGANVYPDNISAALATAGDTEIMSYKLAMDDDRFVVMLEHHAHTLSDRQRTMMRARYHDVVVEGLQRVNSEYRDQFQANPRVADPVIEIHAAGSGPFADDVGRLKRRYTVQGHPEAA